jgi:type VI secretion system secreted protein VgrG
MSKEQPVRYSLAIGDAERVARDVRGEERINGLWRFEIEVSLEPGDPVDPVDVVGGAAALELVRADGVRRIEGVITEIDVGEARDATARRPLRAVLEPRLARLRHRQDIRVFRDKTAPEIVTEVWSAMGVPVLGRLGSSYVRRGYCVQMRESDLDFGRRLLEDEGITWWLTDQGMVVLCDAAGGYDGPIVELPYQDTSSLDGQREAIVGLGTAGSLTPGMVTLRDFNPEHPSLDMDVHAKGPWLNGPEYYDYPGEYEMPGDGSRKARVRAEALEWRFRHFVGRGTSTSIRPGARFTLHGAPTGLDDGDYVPTRVEHRWRREDDGFAVTFDAVDGDTLARPWPDTAVPTLPNPLTGVVTGPAGEDIHTDRWGRVKVHFPWDRLQPKDDTCSDWIPVLQDNTGHSSAMSRTGWEVLCHFMEGDPDRPVVLGRVYNAEDQTPEPLPLRKSGTSLRSQSSPGRKGTNMVRFEDTAGDELILFHAERDKNVVVANDKTEKVLESEAVRVVGHEHSTIGVDQRIAVQGRMNEGTDTNRVETIGGNRKVQVGATYGETVGGNHSLTIGGSHLRTMGDQDTVTAEKTLREGVGGLILEASVKDNTSTFTRATALVVGGAIIELAKLGKAETAEKARGELVGAIHLIKAKERIAVRSSKKRSTLVGMAYTVDAAREIFFNAGAQLKMNLGVGEVTGTDRLQLKVGDNEVVLAEGTILLKSKTTITLETSGPNAQGVKKAEQNP